MDKLKIILDELKITAEKSTIKYINPIIIGTLALTIWESVIQEIVKMVGVWNMLMVGFVLIIVISIVIGIITKILEEDREFIANFDAYSDKKRLEKLLLYCMLTIDD